MRKRSKRYKAAAAKVEKKDYTIVDAVAKVKETASTKFSEAVDIAVRLGVDPKKADQAIRGTVALPHGIGKAVRVLVIAKPPKDEEAKAAGADHVGFQDYLEKIQSGWADVDVIIATPDVMGELGKLGKILGPRGLMPNPKSGTVTPEVGKAVKEVKAGKI
jgi:large subunit ribosomal protein L1